MYWTFVFTDDEILKVKTISRLSLTAVFVIPLILLTIMFGPLGGAGTVIIYYIALIPFRSKAKDVRRQFAEMSEADLGKSGRVAERIGYDSVAAGTLEAGNYPKLRMTYAGKVAKMKFIHAKYIENTKFIEADYVELRKFLSARTRGRIV